jgi:hypothetical protein
MRLDPTVPLRLRQVANEATASRQSARALVPDYPVLVGRVFANPTVPTSTGTFFSLNPVDVTGAEAEGGTGALSVDTSRSFLVYVVGSKAPVAGDLLICRFVGHRWVASRMGGKSGGVTVPGCPCQTSPTTLTMSSSEPDSNNQILQSATLQYGTTPLELAALGLSAASYLSTTTFTDTATGDQFWYYLSCFLGYYALTRLYAESAYGSPYRDIVIYRWLIGASGNSCEPFLLANGTIFPGGDPSCVVTISE